MLDKVVNFAVFPRHRTDEDMRGGKLRKAGRMKVLSLAASLALGALFFASSALASGSGNLQLFEKVTVDGKALSPGQYKVEWDGSGNQVHVKMLKNGHLVATAPAKMTPGNPQDNSGYVTKAGKSGQKQLAAVFFGGKDWTLQLNSRSRHKSPSNAGS